MARTFTKADLEKMLQTLTEKNARAICGNCGDLHEDDRSCACDWDD